MQTRDWKWRNTLRKGTPDRRLKMQCLPPWKARLRVHGLFKSICRSGANPEKVLHIRGGAMQVYHHNQ